MRRGPLNRDRAAVAATLAILAGALMWAPAVAAAGTWDWPVRGELATAYRNGSDAYAAGQHRGIDIAAPVGTPVLAATPGTVTFAGVAGTSGLTVALRTADGRFDTSYLHLEAIDVRAGERVPAGARLGAVGVSGRRSLAAAHLHFGVREAGTRHAYRDPLEFLGPQPLPPAVPPGAPSAAPLRPAPRLVPVSPAVAPLLTPARPPAPVPRSEPRPAPGRLPRGAPAPDRRDAPQAVPDLAPLPVGDPAARPARSPIPHPRPAAPELDLGPAPAGVAQAGLSSLPAGERRGAGPSHAGGGLDLGRLLAVAGLLAAALALGRAQGRAVSSIARRWPITSPRRSTTSTRSPTSATRTRRSRRTSWRGTCASGARTSSS